MEALSAIIQSKASDEGQLKGARTLILAASPICSNLYSSTAPKVETSISLASKNGATQLLQILVQVTSKQKKMKVKQQVWQ